jgi:AcrR family transcriptional regulator
MAIDHEQRRRLIARTACRIIAREGLGGATLRRIARDAGFSTAAITHYFADKDDLLVWTFEYLTQRARARLEAAIAERPPDLRKLAGFMVSRQPAVIARWKVYFAFFDHATMRPELEQRIQQSVRGWMGTVERMFRLACPELPDPARAARLFGVVIQGMATHLLVSPERWTDAQVAEVIEAALAIATTPGLAEAI